ncbi:MAG: NTP transferase domain-containing protein [Candidatus Lokiarchaeota archaeon]|nr:NTP transferase domain-containing protein [Candidatus Lokiarchaeota archaeon]MBD3202179.1 NTP transferase domain-containing protein [Candidatus Lokiarchaeota archaeon]
MERKKYLAMIILAGGKSNRLGLEKGQIKLNDKPLILYQIETLSEFDEDIFLVVNSEEQEFTFKKNITIPDQVEFVIDDREFFPFPGIFTPMIGIYSAFKELNRRGFEKGFILAGDAPFVKSEVIKYLIEQSTDFDCCIPKWENGFLEPLFAIYPVGDTFNRAKEIIKNQNHYALTHLIREEWKTNYISVENELIPLDNNLTSLININGPIDIEKAKELFKT